MSDDPTSLEEKRKIFGQTSYLPERYAAYRLLWVKVIIRAAYDYALWRDAKELRLRKFAQDAERWLFGKSYLMNSFETICSVWYLPASKFRDWAKSLTRDQVKKIEFRERSGREFLEAVLEIASGDPNTDGNP